MVSLRKNHDNYANEGDLKHRLGGYLGLQGLNDDIVRYYLIGEYRDGSTSKKI